MGKSVLDIVIKLSKQGGADRETITSLAQIKTGLMQAGAVAGTFVAAYYAVDKVLDATVGTMITYVQKVRDTQRATQLSAEESSRLIAVTDDLGVSYENLQKAIKSSADTTDFSIEGLAKTSQAYLEITSAQERAKFAQQQYGKAWVDMVGVLEQGPDAIREMSAAVDAAHLFDEEDIRRAEEYRMQLDQLGDSWEGFKMSMGSAILPGLVDFLQTVNAEIAEEGGNLFQAEKGWRMLLGPIGAVWNAIDLFTNKTKEAAEQSVVLEESFSAVTTLGDSYLSMAMNLTEKQKDFSATMTELNAKRAEEVRVLNQLIALGPANSEQIDIQKGKIADLDGQIASATGNMEEFGKRFVLSMLQSSGASMEMQIAYAQAAGLIDSNSAAIMENIADVNRQYEEGTMDVHAMQMQVGFLIGQMARLDGMSVTGTVNIVVNGSVPSLGGGAWRQGSDGGARNNAAARAGGARGRAEGGSLSDFTVVGEKGFEAIVRGPNGQYTVIPHDASKWLLEAGLLPKGATKFLALGGGLSGGNSKPNTLGSKSAASTKKSSAGYNKPSGPSSATSSMFTIGGGGGNGDASSEQMSLATDQAQATKEAAQAAAQVAAVSSDNSMQAANQTAQVVSTIARGNEDVRNELQYLNSQMRELRSELPDTLAAAVQTEI